jgi:hypothetical protein
MDIFYGNTPHPFPPQPNQCFGCVMVYIYMCMFVERLYAVSESIVWLVGWLVHPFPSYRNDLYPQLMMLGVQLVVYIYRTYLAGRCVLCV